MKHWLCATFRQAAWAPLFVFCCNLFASHAFPVNAFVTLPWLDIPTHMAGGLAMAYFVSAAIRHGQALYGQLPGLIQGLLSLGMTSMIAIFWEFMEYACDKFLGSQLNLGVSDTLCDLAMGMLGALLWLAYLVYRQAGRRQADVG